MNIEELQELLNTENLYNEKVNPTVVIFDIEIDENSISVSATDFEDLKKYDEERTQEIMENTGLFIMETLAMLDNVKLINMIGYNQVSGRYELKIN